MKNVSIKIAAAVAALGILLLASCSNFFSSPSVNQTGLRITVSNDLDSRTLYPKADFTKYVLSFEGPEAHDDVTLENVTSRVVNLVPGTWTITAVGYVRIDGTEYAAAQGNNSITIAEGSPPQTLTITISASIDPDADDGYFTYSFNSSGVTVQEASLWIYPFGESPDPDEIIDLLEPQEDPLALSPGYYVMLAQALSGEQLASRTEIVHIYSNMETYADITFLSSDFSGAFLMTFDENEDWDEPGNEEFARWVYGFEHNWLVNGEKINVGDTVKVTYTFKSNVNINAMGVMLVNQSGAWEQLSRWTWLGGDFEVGDTITGTVTLSALTNAPDNDPASNKLIFHISDRDLGIAPKLAFTDLQIERVDAVIVEEIELVDNSYGTGYISNDLVLNKYLSADILKGDIYTFTYSFFSDTAIDGLDVQIITGTWTELSHYTTIETDIEAYTIVSGTVELLAMGAADSNDRLVFFDVDGETAATLKFIAFEFEKTGFVPVILREVFGFGTGNIDVFGNRITFTDATGSNAAALYTFDNEGEMPLTGKKILVTYRIDNPNYTDGYEHQLIIQAANGPYSVNHAAAIRYITLGGNEGIFELSGDSLEKAGEEAAEPFETNGFRIVNNGGSWQNPETSETVYRETSYTLFIDEITWVYSTEVDIDINFSGFNEQNIILTGGSTVALGGTLTVNFGDTYDYEWWLNGTFMDDGNANHIEYTVPHNYALLGEGNKITVIVTIGDVPYSGEYSFTIIP